MATAKSVEITNLDASPRVISEVGSVHGKMRVFADTIAAGTCLLYTSDAADE